VMLAPVSFLTHWQPYEKYVVEMGIDSPTPPKNMDYLLTILKPRTAIFLNVLPTHTQFFSDGIEGIAREKGKLIERLPENGLAILNADDPRVMKLTTKTKAKVMTFGEKGEHVKLTNWQVSKMGTVFEFNKTKLVLDGYALPKSMGMTIAAALCVALDEDFTIEEGLTLIKKYFALEPGRSSLIKGKNGSLIIDSSYNASPGPMKDMLELLKVVPGKRKLALLGEMRELGRETKSEHKKVVELASEICDQVWLVGAQFKGYPGWCQNASEAAGLIKLEKNDVLLVKGSQNTIFLETAVEKLMAEPEKANEFLCRRGEYWDKLRLSV
jgi:UDP-N-acetylmuramoyl-tripeptide--D-alanyl-D-alanine ligase